ncbi:MFS-type transporter SLC18B1-like [Lytechinus variegatus]|uniref:MFS-type transporter SLC18B1-like n=1 Tax=Lytechinus variegatus TaxID=7654 RepID=UPI001BB19851|nr:MFS-type transporter SLC18B1-like [Lytechinus variegatus]XP_041465055.1 MFS-type transporter SLC18B1-like [Lytechinus variegatus]
MDLNIQRNAHFPHQSELTEGNELPDGKAIGQSKSRASPVNSEQMDQSEESANDLSKVSNNLSKSPSPSIRTKDKICLAIDRTTITSEHESTDTTAPESPNKVHTCNSDIHEKYKEVSSCESTRPQSSSPSLSLLISDQSRTTIRNINQSEDSSLLIGPVDSGINHDEHNGNGSEGSYQRDERSKSVSEEEDSKESPKLTKTQVLAFFSLAISIFLDQVSFSVLAPFFPREAKDKGVSGLQIGFIFGAFALVNVIFSPIFGKFLPKLGAKFTFVSGVWIVAGCNILFGFCDEISSTLTFIIFCYVVRCTAALGTAAAVTASFTIAAQTFPGHVAQTIGLMETFGGLGYMIGPVIGGFLYEVGGNDYKIPFIVLGCADLVCVVLSLALLPPIVSEDMKTGSISDFLRIPSVWPVGLSIFVGSASFGFLDPTLSLHVEQFTQSAMVVGLLFLLSGGCYALSSPFWGWMAEKLNISRLMVIIGTIMSGGAFLLMGPSPLLNLPNELWIICLSLALCGIFLSASVICSFNDYLTSAMKNGFPDDMSTQAVVSGIFSSLLALGNFVGPSIGGVVVHLYSFNWSATVIGGIQIGVAIIVALFTLGEFCFQQRRPTPLTTQIMPSVNQDDLVKDSMEPLLKGHV